MDNLTHTLTGLALSRAGLNRWYTRPALVLIISANIPDIDVLTSFRGALAYFENHRGITHSIAMVPVMALLAALITCALGRSVSGWKSAWGLSIIGVASHLLLDWTNAYGVRFFLPFSSRWFRLDLNNLFDFWIWGVLLLAWLGPLIAKLVSSEMGARSGPGRGLAIFALAFFLLYDCGRAFSHDRALAILDSRVYKGEVPVRVAAFPSSAANPFEWSGWAETQRLAINFFPLNIFRDFDPSSGIVIYKPDATAAIDAARHADAVAKFLQFSQYPLWHVTPMPEPDGARRVEVTDWRFPFTATAIIDASNRVLSSSFHY